MIVAKDIVRTGPVVGATTYVNDKLIERDYGFTLPNVAFMTAAINAHGEMNVPIPQLLEDMEHSLTKVGADEGLAALSVGEPIDIEHRWVYLKINANGSTKNVGCKAFLHCLPKGVPELEITPGEITEAEATFTVLRYRLVVDGKEIVLIDRIANICKINGKDYAVDIEAML